MIRWMMKLYFELYKNFKLIFRNISSIALLILGPLTLILLIGFAFSGDSVHGIQIGVKTDDFDALSPIISNFTGIGEVIEYEYIEPCISDMQHEKTHICLEFSDEFMKYQDDETIPSGQILFYYDNSRKKISTAIVNQISEFMGLTSEEISIESAKTIFQNIETLVVFLGDRSSDIDTLVQESYSLQYDLIERKKKLIEFRSEFLPKYYSIKRIQARINNLSSSLNESYSALNSEIILLDSELTQISDLLTNSVPSIALPKYYIYEQNDTYQLTANLSQIYALETQYNLTSIPYFNLTNYTLVNPSYLIVNNKTDNITVDLSSITPEQYKILAVSSALSRIDSLHTIIYDFSGTAGELFNRYNEINSEFDSMVVLLDEFKDMLDDEIDSIDIYLIKIDSAVANILELNQTLNQNLVKLSRLNPSLAEKLIKPIVQSLEPILSGLRDIELVFPTLISLVIVFISMLFANIVTLSELNSKAYLRNLIAPVSPILFTFGLLFTNLFVIMFQVIVLLFVGQYRFHIRVFNNFGEILLVCALLSFIFIFLGMIVAYLFKSEQTSILVATFSAISFFLFSDIIAPLESMPPLATQIASMNPFVLSQGIFKKIILYEIPIGLMPEEMGALVVYFVLGLILLTVVSVMSNKKKA